MKLLTLFFSLFGFTVSSTAHSSQEYTPDYLLQGIEAMRGAAQGKDLNSDDAQAYGYAAGLIIGISDSLNTFDIICTPEPASVLDMSRAVEEFVTGAGYQDLVDRFLNVPEGPQPVDESVMVMFALKAAYPCEE